MEQKVQKWAGEAWSTVGGDGRGDDFYKYKSSRDCLKDEWDVAQM